MLEKNRRLEPVRARRLVFIYYKAKDNTFAEIGQKFGQDYVTIMHGVKVMNSDIENNHPATLKAVKKFNKLIEEYESNI